MSYNNCVGVNKHITIIIIMDVRMHITTVTIVFTVEKLCDDVFSPSILSCRTLPTVVIKLIRI